MQLTDKEVLEKAIQKAIDGGYELVKTKDWIWQVGEDTATGLCIHITPDTEKIGLITYISYPIAYERIIFNHDFAKALWPIGRCICGENHNRGEVIVMRPGETVVHGQHKDWQYHLQMMVISENPIQYLGEHLDG